MSDIPEFEAHELNTLMRIGRRHPEYEKARQLILSDKPISEGQKLWLWAIKRELKEEQL